MPNRLIAMAAATAAVVLAVVGCGDQAAFDPSTRYSPESLAQELAFRCRSLADDEKAGIKPPAPVAKVAKASTKEAAATKEAPDATIDAILDDVIRKASTIPGMTPPEACGKVAAVIAKDPSLTEAQKQAIAGRLSRVAP